MVTVKSSLAIGSFLNFGTHLWLEITDDQGAKTTFSGHHHRGKLAILKNYKKDFERPSTRGQLIVPPPQGMNDLEWEQQVIHAGDSLLATHNKQLHFTSFFPNHRTRGNCATVVSQIITNAGGRIPRYQFKGIYTGLQANTQPTSSSP